MEDLDHARTRTTEFLNFIVEEMKALGLQMDEEPFVRIAYAIHPQLQTVAEHYELREQIAGAFSSAAYKYVTRKWKKASEVIP